MQTPPGAQTLAVRGRPPSSAQSPRSCVAPNIALTVCPIRKPTGQPTRLVCQWSTEGLLKSFLARQVRRYGARLQPDAKCSFDLPNLAAFGGRAKRPCGAL